MQGEGREGEREGARGEVREERGCWEGWGYDSTTKNEEETRRTMEVAHWRRRPSPEPNRNPSIDGE
jgi:hypothetical protein